MSLITWIVLFCLLGGLLSVLAASVFLGLSESIRVRLVPHLVSFATGALLGAAFLGLLPHALDAVGDTDVHVIPMAVLLDLRYPKRRILEVYLNEVYLGQRGPVAICGAESAASFYFGRSLRDLTVGEWAVLAGMVDGHSACLIRHMVCHGYFTLVVVQCGI